MGGKFSLSTSHKGLNEHGGLSTFNMHDGFCEAVCRGFRKGFLTDKEYVHLKSAKNLEDVRLNLQETDYGHFLADVIELSTAAFKEKAEAKFTKEFQYMRSQARRALLSGRRRRRTQFGRSTCARVHCNVAQSCPRLRSDRTPRCHAPSRAAPLVSARRQRGHSMVW